VMDHPTQFIERYRKWSYGMRDAFRTLSTEEDYRYWFDPFWVCVEPYRVSLAPGQSADVKVRVRNFRSTRQTHRIELHTPPGIRVDPPIHEGELAGESRRAFSVRVTAASEANQGVNLVALDVTLNGHRYGQWCDFVVKGTCDRIRDLDSAERQVD